MNVFSQPFSSNNNMFSTCSSVEMERTIASNLAQTQCLVQASSLTNVITTTANFTMPFVPWPDQCARLNGDPTIPTPTGGWKECPDRDYSSSSICKLKCFDSDSQLCRTIALSVYPNRKDGTVCGWSGTDFSVCKSGVCGPEFRTGLCDR